jgi:type III pantothenate kinase
MQIPVVATAVTGCVDVVEHLVTGVLVPPRDPRALAAAIAAYLRDDALRRRHGRAARERIERQFGRERVWTELQAEYVRLLREHRRPA